MTVWFPNDIPEECMEYVRKLESQNDELLTALKTLIADYELLLGGVNFVVEIDAPPLLKDAYAAVAKAEQANESR